MDKKIHLLFGAGAENGVDGEFGIDDEGKLYWNGKPVVTESKVTLDWWVGLSAVLAAFGTLISAGVAVAEFIS